MGVSFKISRTGRRFKPKPVISDSIALNEGAENSLETSRIPAKHESNGKDEDAVGPAGSSITSGTHNNSPEDEISFTLSLYPDGYSIGKPSENDSGLHAAFQEGSKLLHPYDRTSEGLFSAIESGRLPGGILDDVPCKYVDGTLICEVRDYRKCISGSGSNILPVNGSATITKVPLKMSLENVVKDIPLMADDSWTYGDLMEVESRILKALQPKLCLDPTPRLDKLCENPVSPKLNLGLVGKRKRRLRHMPEVTVTSNNRPHGKKICIDRAPESSSYRIGELGSSSGDMITQHVQDNVAAQVIGSNNMLGSGNLRNMSNSTQGPTNIPGMARAGQDMPVSFAENMNSTASGKMENQEGPYPTLTKRTRLDGVQQQQIGSFVDGLQGPDVQWRNQQILQQLPNARGIQYANPGMQKYPQLGSEGVANQDSIKLEKPDVNLVKTDMQMMEAEGSHMDPRQRFQQNSFMRPAFQQANWTNLSQQVDKDPRREDQFPKRKSIQSPRLSAGAVAQSPLSAKSGEVSCGSMGTQYGAVSSAAPFGQLQREKTAVTSIPAVDRATSMTSSANDSMQPQHQAQLTAKRRSNSLSKNPAMSGVGSPASVNNVGGPMNASSPSISTPQLTEQSMIERFAKIEVVAMRHKLTSKEKKVVEYPRKPQAFSAQELLVSLSSTTNSEYVKDENCARPLSQSLAGGSMNVYKIRVLHVRSERTVQGNISPVSPGVRTRMIMSEKPNDGTVAMHYGDLGDEDYLNAEDYLPTLPNTHLADLLAAQFCSLMLREGYMVEDHIQPRPHRLNIPSNSQPNAPGVTPNNSTVDMQQYSDSAGQQTNETKPIINNASLNPSSNVLPSSGMLSAGSSQALQVSQGLVSGVSMPPRPQQMDPQQTPQQQSQPQQQLLLQNQPSLMPQQQSQFPRSPLMLPTNSMPQLNSFGQSSSMPLGNHIGNKPSPLQLLQSQQPQQVPQMQRRMIMGLGPAVGMGTIGNNMVGLGGLGNVMGIGGARGIGGTGISAPMGTISGMGANLAQNQMMSQANAINQQFRAGTLTPQQAAVVQKIRFLHQSRGMLAGNQLGVSGITGGARQMQPGSTGLSMLGQNMSRGNISTMQRSPMGQMGIPKLMPGINVPMNQQQLQHQLQLQMQQQQQQQQQPQQQQMQQQEATSPLQAVVSPQQVGSPSTLGIPQPMNQQVTQQQQQASPQQIGQRTPMSPPLSSGPIHPVSAGNPEVCPASPALSSQTLGSVGSITNSPMDLQGVNKSNSVTNT